MITSVDQDNLFRLVADRLKNDLVCYAFGGTAMMFYGFKGETKDIDIIFDTQKERNEFIQALKSVGFGQTTPGGIYIPEKLQSPNAPLMFKRNDGRFDLFVEKIFHTLLSPSMKENTFAVHEYNEKHTLVLKVFRTEIIVLLKAVTSRDKDFEDIVTIVQKDTHFDWQYLIDEVLWQYEHGDSWIILDTEKMLQELKKYIFVEEKYIQQLHEAVKEKKKSTKGSGKRKR